MSLPAIVTDSASPFSFRSGVSLIDAQAPVQPAASGEQPALHVDRVRAGQLVQAPPLGRVVDDVVRREDRPGHRAGDSERPALPEHSARLVDDPRRVEHGPDREPVAQAARDAERDQLALGHAVRHADPDERRACAGAAATRRSAVVAQAKVSPSVSMPCSERSRCTLPVASNAAEGSKPEWIAQCSQRGSLPGPYSSHSIPSISAS